MRYTVLFSLLISLTIHLYADGVIVPSTKEYPSTFLKNKVSEVDVNIQGLIAETTIYQEFKNEWDKPVDGVYSFPLPADARATRLQYSVGDTLFDAILKVQQQSTTPGTGEGTVIANLVKYMGNNVIKLSLTNISPTEIKMIKLSYISLLNQYNGIYVYNFPLNTSEFIKHPLDYLKINIHVHSEKSIQNCQMPSHPGYEVVYSGTHDLNLTYLKSKAYLASDMIFSYTVENSSFNADLYCWKPDSADGYFTLVGKPPVEDLTGSLPHNVVFLICNSTTMIGQKLEQSKNALSIVLDELSSHDSFNIILYNWSSSQWKTELVPANPENITNAKLFVEGIQTQTGNILGNGIVSALSMIKNANTLSSILAFTDGKSSVYPLEIENQNAFKTSISFIAIGNDVDRVRLEAIASRNFGFVGYIRETNILATEMVQFFHKIKKPIIKDVNISFDNPMVHSLFPEKFPTIYSGTDFIVSGRYSLPGNAMISIHGNHFLGDTLITLMKDFSQQNELSRKLWAKMAIDKLEAQILMYGELDTLKSELVDLSIYHNIRCRYTAYIEDIVYTDPTDPDVDWTSYSKDISSGQKSAIVNNYPNPFLHYTTFQILIEQTQAKKNKVIEFYDVHGKLLKSIDISSFGEGLHEITITREELGFFSNGMIFVHFKVDHELSQTIKIMAY
ncbi:MAG: VIT domain-containing protein [Bacteroidales bacterium]